MPTFPQKLSDWPRTFRSLLLVFHFAILFGYGIGFANLFISNQTSPKGIRQNLMGMTESELERSEQIIFEKPLKDLVITTHNHVMGLSLIFLVVGFSFLLITGSTSRFGLFMATEPFVSLIVTFGSIWLARLIHPSFIILVMISGVLMHLTFSLMLLYNIGRLMGLLRGKDVEPA